MSVSPLPIADLIVAEVGATGYHPRTSGHSDSQSRTIIRDLLAECPLLAQRAASGELVAKLRHHQQVRNNDWVIDIALGTPRGTPQPPETGELIRMTEPTLIQIAIELKSIWTEHGKARKNRLRDFGAFHGHAHDYDKRVVAAAFLVVNAADYFLSPLNLDKNSRESITQHNSKNRPTHTVVKDTIDKFRDIHLRQNEADGPGLEGLGVIVIEHDNINYLHGRVQYESELVKHGHLHRPSRVSKAPPALRPGDPLHYDTMLQRVCVQYTSRYK